MPYYAETGRSRPPNCVTLQITLLASKVSPKSQPYIPILTRGH